MTRVAFGCSGIDVLEAMTAARMMNGTIYLTTRYRPKRSAELIGGSLFWIIKHHLVARMEIADFVEDEAIKKWNIILKAPLIAVQPYARRAHQGWRYLTAADVPPDLHAGHSEGERLPASLTAELSGLGLF